jgi:hypothetical protein
MLLRIGLFGPRIGDLTPLSGVSCVVSSITAQGGFGPMGRVASAALNAVLPDGLSAPIAGGGGSGNFGWVR